MDWDATWLGIANNALVRINMPILQTLDEATNTAMLCTQMIPTVVKNVLGQYDWHSARKRVKLAPLRDDPLFGYAHAFQIPPDNVRIIKVETCLPWTREGNRIYADEDMLKLVYTAYPATPDALDPLVVDAITTQLAAQLAVSLTADSAITSLLYQEAEQKLQRAKLQEDQGEPDIKPSLHSWSKEFRIGAGEEMSLADQIEAYRRALADKGE